MIKIEFIQENGRSQRVEGAPGATLMEVARAHGIEGILAECGGGCSCGTCHIYIEHPWLDALPARAPDEVEMLETAKDADDRSRLSCQVVLFQGLDGMKVRVPADQY